MVWLGIYASYILLHQRPNLLMILCPQPFPLGSETYIGREKCISCVHSFICSLAFVQCLWTLGPRISQYKRKMDMQKIIVTMVPNVLKLS